MAKRPMEDDEDDHPDLDGGANSTVVAADQLRAFVDRIEYLEIDKKAIADDIKDIYAEAKGNGFNTKVLRGIIRLRKQDRNERLEQEALTELYLEALGML